MDAPWGSMKKVIRIDCSALSSHIWLIQTPLQILVYLICYDVSLKNLNHKDFELSSEEGQFPSAQTAQVAQHPARFGELLSIYSCEP